MDRQTARFAGVWVLLALAGSLSPGMAAQGDEFLPIIKPTEIGLAIRVDSKTVRVRTMGATTAQFKVRINVAHPELKSQVMNVSATFVRSGESLTPNPAELTASVGSIQGELALKLDGGRQGAREEVQIEVREKSAAANTKPLVFSGSVWVVIDNEGPQIDRLEVDRGSYDNLSFRLILADEDLEESSFAATDITVEFGGKVLEALNARWDRPARAFRFNALGQGVGDYTVKIAAGAIQDEVGNPCKALTTKWKLESGPTPAQKGVHVPFPEFLPRDTSSVTDFNAFDRVTTRVIRLYYERDAYKVVRTINRNVEELNRSGASFAQDLANSIREKADDATTLRRTREFQAVQAATKAREARQGIAEAQRRLQRNQTAELQLQRQKTQLDQSGDGTTPASLATEIAAKRAELKTRQTALDGAISRQQNTPSPENLAAVTTAQQERDVAQSQLDNLIARRNTEIGRLADGAQLDEQLKIAQGNVESARTQLQALNIDLTEAQREESQLSVDVLNTTEEEDKLRAKQFRQEVVAGLTDRDIYVPAEVKSIDPVTQVSLSVIGEGTIHLRGPIKGINKVARMIHQMDTPVGQVKLGIQTVQINGEHGDRMEYVYERIDKHIAHSRFLTHESMQLFRKAVQQVAGEIAMQIDENYVPPDMVEFDEHCAQLTGAGLQQWRYVNAFFGGDFIRGLRDMDAELLKHDNKLLSLSSMDTLSWAGAMFVTAIAKHSVRESIIERFKSLVVSELPQKEVDYYRALTRMRHADPCINHLIVAHFERRLDQKDARMIWEKALRTYQFSNFIGFFDTHLTGDDTLNNVQYATLRMAQALKAQLVTELELRNLVLERSLLEIRPNENVDALNSSRQLQDQQREVLEIGQAEIDVERARIFQEIFDGLGALLDEHERNPSFELQAYLRTVRGLRNEREAVIDVVVAEIEGTAVAGDPEPVARQVIRAIHERFVTPKLKSLSLNLMHPEIEVVHCEVTNAAVGKIIEHFDKIQATVQRERQLTRQLARVQQQYKKGRDDYSRAKEKHASIRVLDAAIDETEEKAVELLEAMRSHVANVDNYLKRLAIAFEDDVNAQFYNPAMADVRRASRYWDVTFGQVENTTVLTNNRALAKVSPSATMEFNLPARDLLLVEALKGGKALAQEYGNLLKDDTFLAGVGLVGGRVPVGLGSRQSPVQGIIDPTLGLDQRPPEVGSALSSLIPEPAINKFETGTALEVRPVIQPDGHSIVYRFDYMYTTNVREPVRPDEKHLGRVKRHFTSTDVQTSSYELREITRYTVALKASRTARGVPLLEDIPAIGWIFRPAPNAESSLQQNIILGTSTIYPTLFDLMGLRWSPYADQIDSKDLAARKDREREITRRYRSNLLNKARAFVREELGGDLELPPDLLGRYVEPDPSPERIPAGPVSGRRGRNETDDVRDMESSDKGRSPRLSRGGEGIGPRPERIALDPRRTDRKTTVPGQRDVRRLPAEPIEEPREQPQENSRQPRLNAPGSSRVQRPGSIQQAGYWQEGETKPRASGSEAGKATLSSPRRPARTR